MGSQASVGRLPRSEMSVAHSAATRATTPGTVSRLNVSPMGGSSVNMSRQAVTGPSSNP